MDQETEAKVAALTGRTHPEPTLPTSRGPTGHPPPGLPQLQGIQGRAFGSRPASAATRELVLAQGGQTFPVEESSGFQVPKGPGGGIRPPPEGGLPVKSQLGPCAYLSDISQGPGHKRVS